MLEGDPRWTRFKRKFQERFGVDLAQYRTAQMDRRLAAFAERVGATTPQQFWHWLLDEDGRAQELLDRLAINVSELFRNPERWTELQHSVLPELLRYRPSLRCWSAGCSYGAEAYSLAVVLRESAQTGQHRILATDIDATALRRAENPCFTEEDMRNVSPERRARFFLREGTSWLPAPSLCQMVQLRIHDLLRDPYESDFDLILCRNVAIYFNDGAKERLYRGYYEALRPGGVLFLGSTERLHRYQDLGFEAPWPFFYRKPKGGEERWQRAS